MNAIAWVVFVVAALLESGAMRSSDTDCAATNWLWWPSDS